MPASGVRLNMRVLWTHNFDPAIPNSQVYINIAAGGLRSLGVDLHLEFLGNMRSIRNLQRARQRVRALALGFDVIHAQYGSACALATAAAASGAWSAAQVAARIRSESALRGRAPRPSHPSRSAEVDLLAAPSSHAKSWFRKSRCLGQSRASSLRPLVLTRKASWRTPLFPARSLGGAPWPR